MGWWIVIFYLSGAFDLLTAIILYLIYLLGYKQ